MMRNMRRGVPNLFKQGTQHLSGLEAAVLRNVEACEGLSKITRTSLGPNGMNKMVINHLDKLFVTSDAATIMREMEVVHPAAKLLTLAAQMQEQEVGDGSNFVVVLGGELLKKAAGLIEMGLHPRDIVDGYDFAGKKALQLIEGLTIDTIEEKNLRDPAQLARGIHSAIAAKQYGEEKYIANLVAQACGIVMPKNSFNFIVDNVRVVKLMGGGLHQSEVVRGMVVDRPPRGTVLEVKDAKIAVFTCDLDAAQTETKGTVLLNTAAELLDYSAGEEKAIEGQMQALATSGVNMVVTTGAVGDLAQHFLDKFGIMTLKIQSKWQMRRICRAVGAKPLVKLGLVRPDEQGSCSRVAVREVGETQVTVFNQASANDTQVATIILRGSTRNILNDIERAVDDGVNVVRMMTRDGRFIAGAGAADIELARLLHQEADRHPGLEQYAIRAFGDALEVVPRTLAENAGMNEMKVVSQLYAAHEAKEQKVGVDIEAQCVRDMTTDGIIDLLATKISALKLAANTAVTILRVDQIIMAKPAGGPKMGQKKGHWDDDD